MILVIVLIVVIVVLSIDIVINGCLCDIESVSIVACVIVVGLALIDIIVLEAIHVLYNLVFVQIAKDVKFHVGKGPTFLIDKERSFMTR